MKTKFMFKKGVPMLFSAMLTLFALLTATLQAAMMPPLLQPSNNQTLWGSYFYGDYQKGEPTRGTITLWSEDWTGHATGTSAAPTAADGHQGLHLYSGATVTYSNSGGFVYVNSSNELQIEKQKSFTASLTGLPTGITNMNLTFGKSGSYTTATTNTSNVNITGSDGNYSITKDANVTAFDITFKGASSGYRYLDDIVLTASVPTYNVTYDANGGNGSTTDSNDYMSGNTATVLANGFTAPSGKAFICWNTKADGTGTSYNPDDTFTVTENVTLYAQWATAHTITIASGIQNGSIATTPSGTAATGQTVTVTATPATDYELATLSYSDGNGNHNIPFAGNTGIFTMPDADITVTATFAAACSSTYYYKVFESTSDWSGEYLFVCIEQNTAALNTLSYNRLASTALTPSNNTVTSNGSAAVFSVMASDQAGYYYIRTSDGKYLAKHEEANSELSLENSIGLPRSHYRWSITYEQNVMSLQNEHSGRYLLYTSEYGNFEMNNSSTGSSSHEHRIDLFRKGCQENVTVTAAAGSLITAATVNNASSATVLKYSSVEMSATVSTSDDCNDFEGWYDGNNNLVSTEAIFTYTAEATVTLTAKATVLEDQTYELTINEPVDGTVTLNNGSTLSYSTTSCHVPTVALVATPNLGFQFDGWYNGATLVSAAKIFNYALPVGSTTLTARFSVPDYAGDCINGTVAGGVYAKKEVTSYNASTNSGIITLENYVTGTVTTTTTGGTPPLDVVFVLDYSSSMKNDFVTGTKRFEAMTQAVDAFLSVLKDPNHQPAQEYTDEGYTHRVAFMPFDYYGRTFFKDTDGHYKVVSYEYEGLNGGGEKYYLNSFDGSNPQSDKNWTGTNTYSSWAWPKDYVDPISNSDPYNTYYQKAFFPISPSNTEAEIAWDTLSSITPIGSTYIGRGMKELSDKVFELNSNEITVNGTTKERQRVVVVLTDGFPGQYSEKWYFGACDNNSSNVIEQANIALENANKMKNNQGAIVFTIGIFPNAYEDDTSLPTFYTTSTGDATYNDPNAVSNVNRLMHLISSNSTAASSLCYDGSDWENNGYYKAPTNVSEIVTAFESIAQTTSAGSPDINLESTAVVYDQMSDIFVIPATEVENVKVYKVPATGTNQNNLQWGTAVDITNSVTKTVTSSGVQITGFDYAANAVMFGSPTPGQWNGFKLRVEIPFQLAAAANGQSETEVFHGIYETNGGASGLYDGDGNCIATICPAEQSVDYGKITWVQHIITAPTGFDPMNIDSKEDLAWFISYVNGFNNVEGGAHPTANAKLTADLDMSEYIWVPIGYNASHPYKGTFNGNCHTIKGIMIPSESAAEYVSWRFNTGGASTDSQGNITGSGVSTGAQTSYAMGTNLVNEGFFGCLDGANINDLFVTGGLLVTDAISDVNIGGIVGYDYNSDLNTKTNINFAESAIDIVVSEGTTNAMVGGIAGSATGNLNAVMAVGDITINGTAANAGAITGTGGTVKTFYANQTISGDGAASADKNTSGTNGYCITSNDGYDMGTTGFSPTTAYTYGSYTSNNYVTSSNKSLVDVLNDGTPADGYKWIRPAGSVINNDYPIIVKTTNDGSAVVNETANGKVVRYGEINELLGMEKYKKDTVSMFMYNNDTLTVAPSNTKLYIDEHVAMTQNISGSKATSDVNATVGITLDNSANNGEMHRDWHMFSTSLKEVPLGISYSDGNQSWTNPDPQNEHPLNFGSDYSIVANESTYFPSGISSGDQFDFYSFYEDQYHWINFKRKSNNHWHQDQDEATGNYLQITYPNETNLVAGKGYMISLGSSNEKNLIQAKGVLNDGNVTQTLTSTGAHLKGYNLIGNPYQSYLDFNEFASVNSSHIWSSGSDTGYMSYLIYNADKGGFEEYLTDGYQSFSQGAAQTKSQYIYMHQGFFVVKKADTDGAIKFTNDMRVTTIPSEYTGEQPTFRDAQPAYPLVNLFCTDEDGKQEISVIEFERPQKAGSLKMKGLLNGKGNMYIHWGNDDLGSVFIDYMPDYVPVWFDAAEDGVFTMSWNTANAAFGYMHLIDNMTGADIDCFETSSYTFESHVNDMSARFRLVFKPLGIEEETTEQGENFAFFNGSELIVNGEGELSLIDLNGRVLTTQYVTGPQSAVAPPSVAEGLYLLRLTRANDVKVQKIVIRK